MTEFLSKSFTGGETVSAVLPFKSQDLHIAQFNENRGRISLSGAQSKYSACIRDGHLELTLPGEQGTHILKPCLADFENSADSPANEHLTMQIAARVFNIETAPNALCYFGSGEAAYVTKRYDIGPDGTKIQQEDFASLGGITSDRFGKDYKYTALSYEDIGALIRKYIPAWRVEMVKYFDLILFNFLFSNGDAHLKNFSVLKSNTGDYRLAPAYDLIDTQIHLPGDSIFALQKGLFSDGLPFPLGVGHKTFEEFGLALGLPPAIVRKELDRFCADYPEVEAMVSASALSNAVKPLYYEHYHTRLVSFLRA